MAHIFKPFNELITKENRNTHYRCKIYPRDSRSLKENILLKCSLNYEDNYHYITAQLLITAILSLFCFVPRVMLHIFILYFSFSLLILFLLRYYSTLCCFEHSRYCSETSVHLPCPFELCLLIFCLIIHQFFLICYFT